MDAAAAAHPLEKTLQSYGLGQLDAAAAGSVHVHLEGCPDCRRRVAELSSDGFLGRPPRRREPGPIRPDPPSPPPTASRCRRGGAGHGRPAPGEHPARRGWPTTPTMRSSASWGAAAWAWSTSPRTRSWAGWRSSRSSAAHLDQPARSARPLPPRDPIRRPAASPQHRRRLLGPPARREPRPGHGVRRGARPGPAGQGQGAAAGGQRLLLRRNRRRWACSTRTSTAWSTATSSRPT